ncbi:MAG: hypothetical protein ACKOE6_11325, partial [Flammeovirgaceae bacterium]
MPAQKKRFRYRFFVKHSAVLMLCVQLLMPSVLSALAEIPTTDLSGRWVIGTVTQTMTIAALAEEKMETEEDNQEDKSFHLPVVVFCSLKTLIQQTVHFNQFLN